MFRKTTLKNGLRIITVPQKESPSLTVLVLVGTGSKYETKETNGISHFLEHMFFKGTKKRPSPLKVAEDLDKIGGLYNAFTGEDYTGYFAKVAASQFDLALDWTSDIYLNSLLSKEEIEKGRGVIIEEINMYYDHPMSYIGTVWKELLYGDQPSGWDIAGTKETVSRINQKELLSYMRNQYTAKNTVVALAGNIKEKEAIEKVKKIFSKIGTRKPKPSPKVTEKQQGPRLSISFKETDQSHLILGVRGYSLFHPQKYAQEILADILGGMASSRLFLEVREKMGLAYYIHTAATADPDTGYLATQAGIDNKNIERGISAILKEYKKISREGVPREELKKVKEHIKGKTALSLESSDSQASFYAGQELLEKKILTPKEIFAKIDKVSQSDILKVAEDIFRLDKLNLALIGPFKEKEKFERLLKL